MTIETRVYEVIDVETKGRGKFVLTIRCPYCQEHVKAFAWSLAGSGKRCNCGAIFGYYGHVATKKRGE